MSCEYCRYISGHDYRCPNYEPPKSRYYCSACGEGILDGQEYIVNENGEYRHYDCFQGTKELLEWLGYEIKTMEDDYEEF